MMTIYVINVLILTSYAAHIVLPLVIIPLILPGYFPNMARGYAGIISELGSPRGLAKRKVYHGINSNWD